MNNRKPRLQDKVAIVTGAGARGDVMGNGKAVSILFAREGAKVLLVDNVEERAAKTLEAIQNEGGEASVFVADVTQRRSSAAPWYRPPSIDTADSISSTTTWASTGRGG